MDDKDIAVIGSFENIEEVRAAATTLREAGFQNATVYSPVHSPEIREEPGGPEAHLGWFALAGAMFGGMVGLSLTIGASTQWPIMTGGQPIVSLPPFFVVSFELTILFGVIGTFLGMLWGFRQSKINPKFYDSRFAVDRFGLCVDSNSERVALARHLLSVAGAKEVRDEKY